MEAYHVLGKQLLESGTAYAVQPWSPCLLQTLRPAQALVTCKNGSRPHDQGISVTS